MLKMSKVEKRLNHHIGELIIEKNLIKEGDKIMVGLSGGKDSWTLVYFLKLFQEKAPVVFDLAVATLDVYYTPKQKEILVQGMKKMGIDYYIIENNIEQLIRSKLTVNTSKCSFCARLRRAYLYKAAQDIGYNKVALGHHLDDFLETFMMNILYHGRVKGMPAYIKAGNGINELIRPMLYCREEDILRFSREQHFPIVTCNCRENVKGEMQRKATKKLLAKLEKQNPGLKASILTSSKNVISNHLF
ncbi:MAG: ATP-binding protein [Candidatus Margulisbacteria bacterium]|nr:ATP-binding protein [Candidatus Margulisiibacteriota bacterium]